MKKLFVFMFSLLVLFQFIIVFNVVNKKDYEKVPNNYVAVFRGENTDVVYSTYIYKIHNNKKTIYRYVNTMIIMSGYDNDSFEEVTLDRGYVKNVNKLFDIAENNNSYSYVKYIEDDTIYSLGEFKKVFK